MGFVFCRSFQLFTGYNNNNWTGDPIICRSIFGYIFNLGFIIIF